MPHPAVLRRLHELTQGRVIRSDQGVPKSDAVRFPGAVRDTGLFIDVVVSKVVRSGDARRVEEALRGPILDNFEGYASAPDR